MKKIKIYSVVGTRPNFIKAFPLILELQKNSIHKIIHTGQHYDDKMSKIFFKELKIKKPDYLFKIKNKKSTNSQIAEIITNLDKVFSFDKPNVVLIYGDTTSSLAGALAANKRDIPIVHIESGVRSGDKTLPEEMNRILIDNLSDIKICPTQLAKKNLYKENIRNNTFFIGDTNLEALNLILKKLHNHSNLFSKFKIKKNNYIFLTIHRNFNSDNKFFLKKVFNAIRNINLNFIFPIHPRTKKNLKMYKIKLPKNIIDCPPLSYVESIFLQKNSKTIVTDSGGVQKEAYFLNKPCVTLRPNVEWIETTKYNNNILAHKSSNSIEKAIKLQINKKFMLYKKNLFGNNNISKNIVRIIIKKFHEK